MRLFFLRATLVAGFLLYSHGPSVITAAPLSTPPTASNEDNTFKALIRAAEASMQARNYPNAIGLYDSARKLTTISATQKATAQFGYASSLHKEAIATNKSLKTVPVVQAEYEAALRITELPEHLRVQAHEAVGDLLIIKLQRLAAIREYQKILGLPSAKSEATQKRYLNRIFSELKKTAPSSDAITLAEASYQQLMPLQKTSAERATVKDNFAQILLAQNQAPRAIVLWNELANDKTLPVAARVEVLKKVGAIHRGQKSWGEALKTADKMSTLSGATPNQIPALTIWRGRERAATFQAQGDEPKARAEWEVMLSQPQLNASEKAGLWLDIGNSYGREMTAAKNTNFTTQQKQAYESAWNLAGASPVLRTQALLERGQIEINAKNSATAVALLNDGLKNVNTWQVAPKDAAQSKRAIYLALATVYRCDKKFEQAQSALIQAQQSSAKGDAQILQSAMSLSQEAFAAKQWPAARSILLTLQNTWGIPRKTYLLNLVEIEIAEQKWGEARKALNELQTLNLTPEEKATVSQLRAKIPTN